MRARQQAVLAAAIAAAILFGAAAAGARNGERTRGRLHVVAAIEVGGVPSSIVATAGAIWVSTGLHGIVRIRPETNTIVARVRPGGAIIGLAAGFGDLWAIDVVGNRLLRIDPRANRLLAALPFGVMPTALAVGHGRVWVVSQLESTVVGIDPQTSRVRASRRFAYGELWPNGIAATPDGIWVVTGHGNDVTRLEPATAAVAQRVPVAGARTIAVAGGALWIGRVGDEPLVRLDGDGTLTSTLSSGYRAGGRGPALAGGTSVWLAAGNRLTAVDPATGAVTLDGRLPLRDVAAVAVAGDVWVAERATGTVLRIRVRGDG
jgi:DNA-binding beta-propeller fold protein YncE